MNGSDVHGTNLRPIYHHLWFSTEGMRLTRRRMISLAMGFSTCFGPMCARAMTVPSWQRLRLCNPHTGETFDGAYRDACGPLPGAMAELTIFLRDFHCGATSPVDVGVIDFLAAVMTAIGAHTATILSAYRTLETNEMLARTTFGVAENSQHLYARALDVCFDTKMTEAVIAARAMRRGGVGWYPGSGFMHIDVGPVRNWDLDERDLRKALDDGPRMLLTKHRQLTAPARGVGLSPELQRRGDPTPALARSGQLSMELYRSGHLLK